MTKERNESTREERIQRAKELGIEIKISRVKVTGVKLSPSDERAPYFTVLDFDAKGKLMIGYRETGHVVARVSPNHPGLTIVK